MAFDPISAALGLGDTLIKRLWPDPAQQANAQLKLLELAQNGELAEMTSRAGIVEAEAKSEHAITATWRPITMLVFVVIIANNYIIGPYAEAMFGAQSLTLEIPPDMWDLLKIGLGGYIFSRGAEKSIEKWKAK